MTKNLLRLLGVVALAFSFTGAPMSASAELFSDAIVEQGHTTSLSPGIQWEGGTGSFAYVSDQCVGVSDNRDGDDGSLPVEAGLCSETATGTYRSTYCGTGQVSGTSSVSGFDSYTGVFDMILVATIGIGQATMNDGTGGVDNVTFVGLLSGTPSAPGLGTDDSGGPALTGTCSVSISITITKTFN